MILTYFQNHVVTITYDEELQLGKAVWKGFLSSSEFREAIEICVQLMEEHKPLRWLGDNRKLRAIRKADQEWFAESIFPKLAASTLRRNGAIVSEDLFNRMAVEQLVKRAKKLGDMVIKEFDNEDEAIAWIKEPITLQEQA
ncbi:STAS/SEC14 domain-containing protein [Pontibacter sp. BT310]|uniref:STAS/SEC14 domain-containing protein n=1 Tax=Pontibacter populi TaxID=890055 RepID=A0ABS6X9A4_9BACT|nr:MULTISPECIES: STAS/SEC14 domain-containing protein [Pontibacter]MBJ6117709.1 STAS/SEC14 domain-containing protein [Pontibacter sp. BT310]MBR0570135.1 STAS/SEC14 domain-containing protein [Microvirga sp. STS03]MBW3364561.1 STAS/SEC14 domain-containing protein [Pontibacter populi]